MSGHYAHDRDRLVYELIMRQEPKQARMCGVGGKADRRPIDPPPIVQLRVIDPAANERRRRNEANGSPAPNADDDSLDNSYAQSFLQNPYYFMFASLAKPDDDAELHWLKDGRTRCTTGSVVSSLYHLKDPQNNNEDAGFFVFPDLSVRTEGSYRLKLSLFEVVGNNVRHCKSIYSAPFYVYTAKKFPGMEESTPLSCSLADQGIKIRIRKDIRVRKRPNQGYDLPLPLPMDEQQDDEEDDQIIRREPKRTRTDDGSLDNARTNGTVSSALAPLGQQPQQPQQQSWPPPTGQDPALGPSIPPPPNATMSSTLTVGDVPGSGTMNMTSSPSIPGPPATYDSRAPAQYPPYDQTSQPMQQTQPQQPYRDPNQPSAAPQQPPPQHMPPPPPAVQHQPQPQPPQQPQPQQQVYQQPPAQHMPPPPGHVHAQPPPPPHGHMAPAPPPPPQGYAPYPQTWGAPPPPQQPVYDGYYHHQQHAPPVPQHHYAAHPNAYAQPPPPPAHVTPRYDYYQQQHPPMPAQYGYYDQSGQMHHQQLPPQQQQPAPQYAVPPHHQGVPPHHQPPPPHPQYVQPPPVGTAPQQPVPGQTAAPALPPPATGSPNVAPPPIAQQTQQHQQPPQQPPPQQQAQPPAVTPNYDYSSSYRPATGSPQPRPPYAPPHPQQTQPPPPPPYTPYTAPPPPHMQQRMNPYPPPPAPYYYGTPQQPPPATANVNGDWSTNGYTQQQPPASAWPDYSQPQPPMQPQHQPPHIQQPNPIQPQPSLPPPVPQTPTSSSSSLMGATNGDRIQLAPLRSGSSGHASSASGPPSTGAGSPVLPLSSPVAVTNGHHTPQQQQQNGYVMSPVRSNSRDGYGPSVTPPSRERDDRSGGRESSRESDGRKKNPLAINSIISDDHTR